MNHSDNALPAAIEALGSDRFATALLAFIQTVAHYDSAVIMAYPDNGALKVVHNALHAGDQSGFGGLYREGLWLLSPTHLGAKAGRRGFFHLLDIAPQNFRDSEYYALYYSSNGVQDQTVFLLETGDGTPLAISLERTSALPPYSARDKAALERITGTVAALVRKQWPGDPGATEDAGTGLHEQVQQVLQQFGATLLTPRERDVAQLILRGYPSKAAAVELGISSQTEQVHRRHIYQKLGLSSHNQLFSLFFDALALPGPLRDDPLPKLLGRC